MNNRGTDQTARMRRLVCTCVVRKTPEDTFSHVEAQIMAQENFFRVKFKMLLINSLNMCFGCSKDGLHKSVHLLFTTLQNIA